MNMKKAEERGTGIQVAYDEISEEKLSIAISELLHNQKYQENAKIIASRFKDRPLTPQKTVVYYTEYVARHNGANFLKAAGNDLNFIQFYLLDVYFAIILAIITLLFVLKMIFKWILKYLKIDKEKKKKL